VLSLFPSVKVPFLTSLLEAFRFSLFHSAKLAMSLRYYFGVNSLRSRVASIIAVCLRTQLRGNIGYSAQGLFAEIENRNCLALLKYSECA